MLYQIPFDYTSIFRDKLLIITGAGRSGTTLLGKLIGSMQPSYYFFEPYIMRLFGTMVRKWMPMILFEDYFLPVIQGRSDTLNPSDDSYIFNYRNEFKVAGLSKHKDAVAFIKEEKPLFIIKIPEFQPCFTYAKQIFPGVKFTHIIRNGNDVICSTVNRGWYTDEWLRNDIIEHMDTEFFAPWYIDKESHSEWSNWNPATRTACVWRCCIEKGIFGKNDRGYMLRYEELISNPRNYVKTLSTWLDLKPTEITERHIKDIKISKGYDSILDDIQEPEKQKYKGLMAELGYAV